MAAWYQSLKNHSIFYLIILIFPASMLIFHFYFILSKKNESQVTIGILERSFSEVLSRYQYLPDLLRHDPRVQFALSSSDESRDLNDILVGIKESSGVGVIYLLDEAGTVVSSSNYRSSGSFIGKNYGFRPYFNDAIQSGYGSYYGVGVTTGAPGYFIASRVSGTEGSVGVIVVKIELEQMNFSWEKLQDKVFISNEDDIVIMSNSEEWLYKSLSKLSEEKIKNIEEQRQFSNHSIEYVVESEFKIDFLSLRIWDVFGRYHIMNSEPLILPDRFTYSDWKIHSALSYSDVLKLSFYVSIANVFILFSSYIFVQNKRAIKAARIMEEAANKKRRAELQAVINSTQVGIVTLDREYTIQSANPVFFNMLDKSRDDLIGKHLGEFIELPADIDSRPSTFSSFVETEIDIGRSDTRPVMYSFGDANLEDTAYVVTVVDISKRKKAEKQLQYWNANLEKLVEERTMELHSVQNELFRQEKMVVLGRMAGAIVHEVSQPVASLSSALATTCIKLSRKDYDGVAATIDNIVPLCDHMKNIILQLRAFGYSGANEKSSENLKDILETTLENLAKADEKKQNVLLCLPEKKYVVKCNAYMLEMAIGNIVRNACDATEHTDNAQVNVCLECDGERVSICVKDNGGRMTDEVAEHIFEPFYTTKTMSKGLGIGLPIAKNAIMDIGGDINISFDDKQTSFIITLPLVE